jgi:hypothetical protein
MIEEVPSAVSDSAARAERALPDYPKDRIPRTIEPITYGFRAQVAKGWGVAVANLSLLNTDWYCKQLKSWGAPISLTDDQIEELVKGGLMSRDRSRILHLGEVMIRDMVATNTGITLKWPDDYAVTSDQFQARVFKDYHPRIPIYFATTVDPSSMEDLKGHLIEKGLAFLVVGQEVPQGQEFDGPASTDIFLHRLRLNSTLDPRVVKDENEVGLIATYAKMFLDVAQYAAGIGDTATCLKASDNAVRLGLDPGRRPQIELMASKNLADAGVVDKAQIYLDSAATMLNKDGSARGAVAWAQAAIYRAAGKYAAAESLYLALAPIQPEVYWELSEMYRTGLKDNARAEAALDSWYGRVAQDWPNTARYVEGLLTRFGDRVRARQVLETWKKKNPRDSAEAGALLRTI